MVKWIRSIEFVASEKTIGKGYGGKNEDDEYYPMIVSLARRERVCELAFRANKTA